MIFDVTTLPLMLVGTFDSFMLLMKDNMKVRDDENEPVCSYGLCQWDQSASVFYSSCTNCLTLSSTVLFLGCGRYDF